VIDLRIAIETALGSVPFEAPVSAEYCKAVYAALRLLLPIATIEVFHRAERELIVEARQDGKYYALVVPLV